MDATSIPILLLRIALVNNLVYLSTVHKGDGLIEVDDAGVGAKTGNDERRSSSAEAASFFQAPSFGKPDDESGAIGVAATGGVDDRNLVGRDSDFLDLAVFEPGDAAPLAAHLEHGVLRAAVEEEPNHLAPVFQSANQLRLF